MTDAIAVNNRGRRPVLVGVDGSVSAQGALTWAAAEASYRNCPLHIVHAVNWPTIGNPLDPTVLGPMSDGLRAAAAGILADAETYARREAPGIGVTAELFVAGAAPALLSQAQDAELVVLGSRGVGGFRGLFVGSVSATLAAHASCPVIVVRPHREGTAFRAFPRIVVGIDGSEVSTAAIRFAFEEAVRRHVGVIAVHAARPPRRHPSDSTAQDAQQLFLESLDSLRVPGIDLQTKLVRSHPAQALINESADAELVVVGSHGDGGFDGMLLGSVSQAVLQHARCPVAVVHPRPATPTAPLPAHRPHRQIAAQN